MKRVLPLALALIAIGSQLVFGDSFSWLDGRIDAAFHLDEGGGVTGFDSIRRSTGAELVNGPAWVTGKYGKAVSLDGVNDTLTIRFPPPDVNITTQTIAFWFWPKDTTGAHFTFSKKKPDNTHELMFYQGAAFLGGTNETNGRYTFGAHLPSGSFPQPAIKNIGRDGTGTSSLTFDGKRWHHIFLDVAIGTQGVLGVTLDGGPGMSEFGYDHRISTGLPALSNENNSWVFGGHREYNANANVEIDEVVFFKPGRLLTLREKQDFYRRSRARMIIEGRLPRGSEWCDLRHSLARYF